MVDFDDDEDDEEEPLNNQDGSVSSVGVGGESLSTTSGAIVDWELFSTTLVTTLLEGTASVCVS